MTGARREHALAGTLAVALALGCGRWGSYLGRQPIFLTDILVAAACVRLVWENERRPGRRTLHVRIAPFLVLMCWTLLRFIAGGRLDLTSLRDAVPYLYAVLGIVSGVALARSTVGQRARTARLLVWVLGFHAAWVFVDELAWRGLSVRLPLLSATQGVHVLSLRPDFDVAIVGVYASYLLSRVLRHGWSWRLALGLAMSLSAIIATDKRSGMLGAAVPLVAVAWGGVRHWRMSYQARMLLASSVVFATAATVLFLPSTVGGQRLLATVGLSSASGPVGTSSVGTTSARERAWIAVERYSLSDPARSIVGVGFGPDFMSQSGALVDLVGQGSSAATDPRSPHSWWLGTQARLGVVGLAIVILFVLMLLRQIPALYAETDEGDDLIVVSMLVILALILPLSLGVIMESPFGAVPFFWCAGVVLNRNNIFGVGGELGA